MGGFAVSVETLIDDLKSSDGINIATSRQKILDEFDAASTAEDRGRVLAVFKAVMDLTERNLIANNEAELLEKFREAREQDYRICIVKECTVGLNSPGGGDVSVERMMAVTNREMAAGRMTQQHTLRQLAVNGAAAPHLSDAQLVEKHAQRWSRFFGQGCKWISAGAI